MAVEPLDEGDDDGAGALLLPVGLFVPVIFNAFAQSQDFVGFLIVFGAFAACLLYGEANLSLQSGMALATGLLLTALFARHWLLTGLGICAGAVSLAKYSLSGPMQAAEDGEQLDLRAVCAD